ncbi:MAG: TetR/AcrR family transcriptional regulator [Alphaproteobacteria bacterium]|nr:TetR/AcrR family transcriptional regulator [Alphaproteobacteria bacterium]
MNDTLPRRGVETRDRLLETAEQAVLAKGFAATSIDELIATVGITKSGFFYHFKNKEELAKALLQRYIDNEDVLLDSLFDRADELHEDPLHGFLIGLKMLAEMMTDLPDGHPGCLVASYCYQENLFSKDVHALNKEAVLAWRSRFRDRFDLIAAHYPPRVEVDLDALADMVSVLVDGGIIISKVVREKNVLPQQIMLFRDYVRVIFLGT